MLKGFVLTKWDFTAVLITTVHSPHEQSKSMSYINIHAYTRETTLIQHHFSLVPPQNENHQIVHHFFILPSTVKYEDYYFITSPIISVTLGTVIHNPSRQVGSHFTSKHHLQSKVPHFATVDLLKWLASIWLGTSCNITFAKISFIQEHSVHLTDWQHCSRFIQSTFSILFELYTYDIGWPLVNPFKMVVGLRQLGLIHVKLDPVRCKMRQCVKHQMDTTFFLLL